MGESKEMKVMKRLERSAAVGGSRPFLSILPAAHNGSRIASQRRGITFSLASILNGIALCKLSKK